MKWKTIANYPLYQISDEGHCRRKTKDGYRYLKPSFDKDNYHRYRLYNHEGNKPRRAHRLVYEAFVGEIPDGYVVNHIDFNRTNNKVKNLEIMTQSDNNKHSFENGRYDNKAEPFTEDEVLLIRYHLEVAMMNCLQIAEMFQCNPARIYAIKQNRRYARIF